MTTPLKNYWYIHKAEMGKLVGREILQASGLDALQSLTDAHRAAMREDLIYKELADDFLQKAEVQSLSHQLLSHGAEAAGLFVHHDSFWCNGVTKYSRGDVIPQGKQRPFIHGKVVTGNGEIRLELPINPEHLMSSSASSYLSKQIRLFVLGHVVRLETDRIIGRPLAIASADFNFNDDAAKHELRRVWYEFGEVKCGEIDSFKRVVDLDEPPTLDELKALKDIREDDVKGAFAEIIGEPYVGTDWGGEQSDLFSARLKFAGREINAAFAFKGPGMRQRLTIANMGKNGDQALRLAQEPAELLVVQHWREIDPQVRKLMRALVAEHLGQRMFCLIDGADTWRILKAYGKCGIN